MYSKMDGGKDECDDTTNSLCWSAVGRWHLPTADAGPATFRQRGRSVRYHAVGRRWSPNRAIYRPPVQLRAKRVGSEQVPLGLHQDGRSARPGMGRQGSVDFSGDTYRLEDTDQLNGSSLHPGPTIGVSQVSLLREVHSALRMGCHNQTLRTRSLQRIGG